jgi:hypothetical protein
VGSFRKDSLAIFELSRTNWLKRGRPRSETLLDYHLKEEEEREEQEEREKKMKAK